MLRLIKTRKHEIAIALSEKKNLFRKDFLIAFFCALFLHLLAYSMIKIHSSFFSEEKTLSPIIAFADIQNDEEVFAQIHDELMKNSMIYPPETLPTMLPIDPSLSWSIDNSLQTLSQAHVHWENNWDHFFLNEKEDYSPLQIHVSGPLAERECKNTTPLPMLPKQLHGCFKANYEVLVENQTGEVFWKKNISPTEISILNNYAEQVINNLQFQKVQEGFATAGEIEIVFYD